MITSPRIFLLVCLLVLAVAGCQGGTMAPTDSSRPADGLLSASSVANVTTPVPIPVDVEVASLGLAAPSAGVVAYEALTPGTSFLPSNALSPIDGQPYVEYADDCHLTMGGVLTSFSFGYFNANSDPVEAVVTFHENTPADASFGTVVAGPYTIPGLAAGLNVATVNVPDAPVIPGNVWFAISFNPGTAGLVITPAPSPTVGVSHDLFLEIRNLSLVFFGGPPDLANFMISIEVADPVLEADIDIKPESDTNPVNAKGSGFIPVAILTTETFDATLVDATTLAFGPNGAAIAHRVAHEEDVDGDGDIDLMLHFRTQETGIAPGDTEACLTGELLDGTPIEGCDTITTVPMDAVVEVSINDAP